MKPIVLVAASLLSIPARRVRALALGDEDALRDWIASESATRLAEARRDARLALERIEAAGASLVGIADPAYPQALLDLADPPPFLVVRGALAPAPRGGAGVAIVGTREATPARARYASALAAALGPGPIVSGLALGIDAAAHRGALAAGVTTIAYVAHGLGETYPPEHGALEDAIVAAGGAIASERLPGERVARWALTRRDRLQAAHARAVALVESERDGGAMHAMRVAGDLGRTRFALDPGDEPSPIVMGNGDAIASGAKPLSLDVEVAAERLRASLGEPRRHGAALPLLKERA